MTPKYYDLNGTHVAMIGKAGNTAIGKAILLYLKPYYEVKGSPENVARISNGPGVWQTAPKTELPINPIIPVRDPIERFRSACAQDSIADVNALLDKLEAGERPAKTFHYSQTSNWLIDGARLYKFPEQIDGIAKALGLAAIPQVNDNESNNIPKADLTPEQLTRVQAIYADDIALYESITEAGQTYVAPPEPVTGELKIAKIRELESARYQAEVSGIELPDGRFVRTDKETQAELGKALSIISTVNPSLEIDWKFPDGEVVHMDATQIQEIAGAVFTHVQSTRTAYKDKAVLVEAATTKDELGAITW